MKILFVMRTTVYVRNFESTLRLLAQRGHQVHILAHAHRTLDSTDLIRRLMAAHPGITHGAPPEGPVDGWAVLGEELRRGVDYLRYQRPEYRNAPKLRKRADKYVPPFVLEATKHPLGRSAAGMAAISRALRLVDRALPIDPLVMDVMREQHPDLLIVTPLVEPGSPQAQYLRAARALGIRTALCVYSWDNLTNKGLIQGPLDLVTVWNEPMKREAVELHGLPRRRVVVTGTPAYDHWFDWKPRSSREEFCGRVGLRADRPYLLYLCSSKFIAPQEVPFVRWWIEQIRSASPVLAETGVLIRPHPQWARPWSEADFTDLDGVAVWPRAGANPVDVNSRSEYYDSIFHSAGVVGVNTSAQIESAIVGRGVYTLLAPEFRSTQDGTLHFRHLRQVNGGMLHVAETVAEHVAQLEAAVRNQGVDEGRCRRFVEAFVRPFGIDVPATPRLVAALEQVMSRGRRRSQGPPWYAGLVRPRLAPFTIPLAREEERLRRKERLRRQGPEGLVKTKKSARAGAPREVRRAARVTERERAVETAPQLSQRVVETYEDVRARVRQMKTAAAVSTSLGELEPLWNATPDMLSRLRHYGACVGGARPSDYVDVPEAAKKQFHAHFRKLRREAGDALVVGEAPVLGQFGIRRGPGTYTADTLAYYEILAALKLGAVLSLLGAPTSRPVVWEMSRGWGGFAYQFKTLFPQVTYILSSHPDLFLLSASYLRILFPQAKVRFYGEGAPADLWRDLSDVDFVFVPDHAGAVCPPYLTVALDLMTLERMPPDEADGHVRSASDLGATYFYSPAPPPGEGSHDVRTTLSRYYWLYELPVPQHNREVLQPWPPQDPGGGPKTQRAHIMGWKRLPR